MYRILSGLIILLFSVSVHAQSIHYYGWDTLYSHYPTDIITTQDGGFLIIGDVSSSAPLIENYVSHNYLVHTDSIGDTLWTRYYAHDAYGNQNIFQDATGNYHTLGATNGGYLCGIIGVSVPLTDYCHLMYSPAGDSLSFSKYNDNCWDDLYDFTGNPFGRISAVAVHRDFNANYAYSIKIMNTNGIITNITLPNNYVSDLEMAGNGYWLASVNGLGKVSFTGTLMWQNAIPFIPDIADFCKVNDDSLVFICGYTAGPPPDTSTVIKTDSAGQAAWTRTCYLKAAEVMMHSSGNYVITGQKGDSLAVLVLSPAGDSIWSSQTALTFPAKGIKTIEASGGRIATLAYSGGSGLPGQYALVLDSIGSATGISDQDGLEDISVYPNPATEYISVNWTGKNRNEDLQLKIYTLTGSLNGNFQVSGNSQISVRNFSPGIYFYAISAINGTAKRGKIMICQ